MSFTDGINYSRTACSFGELGFEDKVVPVNQKDGIWILDSEYPVGTDFAETMELKDAIIDFEITPNRPAVIAQSIVAINATAVRSRSLRLPKLTYVCFGILQIFFIFFSNSSENRYS